MTRQFGATALTTFVLMAWFPAASGAQDSPAINGKTASAVLHPPQVSQKFLSRLFPIKGELYPDRHDSPTRDWSPSASRPIEQFQDKEAAQETCWAICSTFLNDPLDLRNCGMAFIYMPSDDFDRQHWSRGGWEGPGRHVLSFKRDNMYVTVVIQLDMIAFTFEYTVDAKEPDSSLAEIQKKIAAICPFLEDLVLEEIPPKEDNAGWAKAGLGKAKAKDPQRFNQDWVDSIRWWREPGRFGIASTIFWPNMPTGRVYMAPYLD